MNDRPWTSVVAVAIIAIAVPSADAQPQPAPRIPLRIDRFPVSGPTEHLEPEVLDFRYQPARWQTCIGLPDDPYKTIVGSDGALYYEYGKQGPEAYNNGEGTFGTRVAARLIGDGEPGPLHQSLEHPRVPIVISQCQVGSWQLRQEAWAGVLPDVEPPQRGATRIDYLAVHATHHGSDPATGRLALDIGTTSRLALDATRTRLLINGSAENVFCQFSTPCEPLMDEPPDEAGTEAAIQCDAPLRVQRDWAQPNSACAPCFRHVLVAFGQPLAVRIPVSPGASRHIALGLIEGWHAEPGQRPLRIEVEGAAARDVDLVREFGRNTPVVLLVTGRDEDRDGTLRVQVLAAAGAPDRNTILSGLWSFAAETPPVAEAVLAGRADAEAEVRMDADSLPRLPKPLTLAWNTGAIAAGTSFDLLIALPQGELARGGVTLGDAAVERQRCVAFWQQADLPYDRITVPDPALQGLLDSCVRNIYQAREWKAGKPKFQVGPTCYRGTWAADGPFLLEAVSYLGRVEEARAGLEQQVDGDDGPGGVEFSKKSGLRLWMIQRHFQLTGDRAWLERMWPRVEREVNQIIAYRRMTQDDPQQANYGLMPIGFGDGGLGGKHREYTNVYWTLAGLKAAIDLAQLVQPAMVGAWQAEYEDYWQTFDRARQRDKLVDEAGHTYVPVTMRGEAPQLPQCGAWAFLQAVFPGRIFEPDDPLMTGTLAMLDANEREGLIYGTGWIADGIWNYAASFYAHAHLWLGHGPKAASTLYAMGNHASPLLCWREEQNPVGQPPHFVGDMPHNWGSAEFIRLVRHLLILERGAQLHLLAGLPAAWTRAGAEFRVLEVPTSFGDLSLAVKVADDGHSARITVHAPVRLPPAEAVLHLESFGRAVERVTIDGEPVDPQQAALIPGRSTVVTVTWQRPASRDYPQRLTEYFEDMSVAKPLVVRTGEDWETHRRELRAFLLDCVGLEPLPARPPLDIRLSDPLDHPWCTVRRVSYQLWPGVYSTGLLYLPKQFQEQPAPAVLCPHGHWDHGNAHEVVQSRCLNLARLGYVVFSSTQHHFEDLYVGVSHQTLMIWNNMRAIDFLQSLPEVDGERIGVAGASGGGLQTQMVVALDPRVKAATIVGLTCNFREIMFPASQHCMCNHFPNVMQRTDHPEISVLGLPCPVQYLTMNDWTRRFEADNFPTIRQLCAAHGVEDRVFCRYFDTGHDYDRTKREYTYWWLERWLRGRDTTTPEPEPETLTLPVSDVEQLAVSQPQDKGFGELARLYREERSRRPVACSTVDQWQSQRAESTAVLRGLLGLHTVLPRRREQVVGEEERREDLVVQRIEFPSEGGLTVPAWVLRPSGAESPAESLEIILDERGKDALLAQSGDDSPCERARHGATVVLPDVRTTGELFATGEVDAGAQKTAWQRNSIVWGRPVTGMAVTDLQAVIDALVGRDVSDSQRVKIITTGSGDLAVAGLFGMVLDPRITEADLDFAGACYENRQLALVPGILLHGDIAVWAACVADRALRLRNLPAAAGDLGPVRQAFQLLGHAPNLITDTAQPPQSWIRVSDDGRSFVCADSGSAFVPWGFNYDHDADGRLIEDYWETEWDTVEEDFEEMQQLGANVVRVHLQFGKFLEGPDTLNARSLRQLERLVRLAERLHLYLDVTGLGCYHQSDVPAWYDQLDETARWQAQAKFWEAVATVCAGSPAIFCYDLMNEPVVPGGDQPQEHWLGPPFAGKHFVQFITRDRGGRVRREVARQWIEALVSAIRKHDARHPITVGLVDWSLDRPGLTSGFDPRHVAEPLDFVAVHIYPERDKIPAALETLRGFCLGKPVVVEETFPLRCDFEQMQQFVKESRAHAAGWISFYWGRTAAEYRARTPQTLADAIVAKWLDLWPTLKD